MTATKTQPGLFITLEGIEGAGKSTHMAFLKELFKAKGKDVIISREPGGTRLGEQVRDVLLSNANHERISDNTELLLMFAARSQHLDEVIRPALARGTIVICDRFTDSSYAYQGGGRGIDLSRIAELEQWVQGDLRPDITLLLDLPVELGLERAGKRSDADRFESETVAFFESVRRVYLDLAATHEERIAVIDASQDIQTIQSEIKDLLTERGLL